MAVQHLMALWYQSFKNTNNEMPTKQSVIYIQIKSHSWHKNKSAFLSLLCNALTQMHHCSCRLSAQLQIKEHCLYNVCLFFCLNKRFSATLCKNFLFFSFSMQPPGCDLQLKTMQIHLMYRSDSAALSMHIQREEGQWQGLCEIMYPSTPGNLITLTAAVIQIKPHVD